MNRRSTLFIVFVVCFMGSVHQVQANRASNRYLTQFEQPASYFMPAKDNYALSASLFYTMASSAGSRAGGKAGVSELWGKYDLKDVIDSYVAVTGADNPAQKIDPSLIDQSIKFKLGGGVRTAGLVLGGNWVYYAKNVDKPATAEKPANKRSSHFSCGFSLPVMHVNSNVRYTFDAKEPSLGVARLIQAYGLDRATGTVDVDHGVDMAARTVDLLRRTTHDLVPTGLKTNTLSGSYLGDLNIFLRGTRYYDHVWLFKGISWTGECGVMLPTSTMASAQNRWHPGAIPVGNNGHWGFTFENLVAFELKQDITVGLMYCGSIFMSHTTERRLPVGSEPAPWSSLMGKVRVQDGGYLKLSPFLKLGNMADGLDFELRYSYLRHGRDVWTDKRPDQTIQSFLQKDSTVISAFEKLTSWRGHFASFTLQYTPKPSKEHIKFAPRFFLSYDMPISCRGMSNVYTVNLGMTF